MDRCKSLYMLIGPKGSGKTTIGTILEQRLGLRFLRVEPIWLQFMAAPVAGKSGWDVVREHIGREFETTDHLVIESLGAGEEFAAFRAILGTCYRLRMVKVVADLEECLRRVRERDSASHIPVSDERVIEYNRIAAQVRFDGDLVIDNNDPASAETIVRHFGKLLGPTAQ